MHIDLKRDDTEEVFSAEVLAIIYRDGKKLFAVTALLDNAPWYALIHEDSTAWAYERDPPD